MSQTLAIKGDKKTVPEELKIRWPVVTEEDKDAVMKVLNSRILGGVYPPQAMGLEEDFVRYIGTKYCLATSSGTAALHIALAAVGIGPGDEVITSAFSFVATVVSIVHQNAIPVFVDIDPETFNIVPRKIEGKISKKTKAIIPVHIHGIPADMDEIIRIGRKHHLVVIEDAAQAHRALYKGKKVGNLSDLAAFSTNFTKDLAGGQGGLLVTNSEKYRDKANMIRCFGEHVEPDTEIAYNVFLLGWNYRTQELPAAFTRGQLKRLDESNEKTRRDTEYLSQSLKEIEAVQVPFVPSDRTSVYHKYRIRLNPASLGLSVDAKEFRNTVRKALRAEGVDAVLWQEVPIPGQTMFKLRQGYGKGCPWTCQYASKVEYNRQDYLETQKLLDDSLVIFSEDYPIVCQKRELVKYYAEAFHKVFDNLEQLEL